MQGVELESDIVRTHYIDGQRDWKGWRATLVLRGEGGRLHCFRIFRDGGKASG